jgi:hypothetical protein
LVKTFGKVLAAIGKAGIAPLRPFLSQEQGGRGNIWKGAGGRPSASGSVQHLERC